MTTETEMLKSLVAGSPQTIAVITVVIIFLRYIAKRDTEHEELNKATQNIISENTRALGENVENSRVLSETMAKINDNVLACQLIQAERRKNPQK